jgi:hypothetical protein
MRYPEDRGRPCIGGCLKDGIAGFYGRATSLTGCLVWPLSDAMVLWMGLAIARHRSPLSSVDGPRKVVAGR